MKKNEIRIGIILIICIGTILNIFTMQNSEENYAMVRNTSDGSKNLYFVQGSADPEHFISVWNTSLTCPGSSSHNQIKLPLDEFHGEYDFTVDWGDSTNDTITWCGQPEQTHTYDTPGAYNITINGNIRGWQFLNSGDKLKLIKIVQWGCLQLGNGNYYFDGCENLQITATDFLNLAGTTSFFRAFANCKSLGSNGNMNNWDVSNVYNMGDMFKGASSFNQNIGDWEVSNVVTMMSMFDGASSFNQDIGGWDVSNVVTMDDMLNTCHSFNQDIGGWDVSQVTGMSGMFRDAYSFNQDIGEWNVSKVESMHYLLDGATSFNQDLGGWDRDVLLPSR